MESRGGPGRCRAEAGPGFPGALDQNKLQQQSAFGVLPVHCIQCTLRRVLVCSLGYATTTTI